MSILNKQKTDGGALVPVSAPARGKSAPAVVLSSSPRANLLPPEITDNHRRRSVRAGLRAIIVVAVIIAIAGTAGAWYFQYSSQEALAEAQSQTGSLAQQKAAFKDVTAAKTEISLGTAAVRVGGGTDVDWAPYLRQLQSTLPSGVTLTAVGIKSADAQSVYGQSTIPLDQPRVATITFSASSTTLPRIPEWIDGLSSLPGFAGASPSNVSQGDGAYTATVVMNVDEAAYSHRFNPKKGASK